MKTGLPASRRTQTQITAKHGREEDEPDGGEHAVRDPLRGELRGPHDARQFRRRVPDELLVQRFVRSSGLVPRESGAGRKRALVGAAERCSRSVSSSTHASASARGSSAGTARPAPNSRTASPTAPRSDTTAGRPWPNASASTPDDSISRYGQDDGRRRRHERRHLRVRDETKSPVDRVSDAERRRELEHRVDRLERVSCHDKPNVGYPAPDLRHCGHQHVEALVSPDEAEEEKRAPGRRFDLVPPGRVEDRVGDADDLAAVDPEVRETVDSLARVHDDAARRGSGPRATRRRRVRAAASRCAP